MRLRAGAPGAAAVVRSGPVPPHPREPRSRSRGAARAPWPRCRAPSAAPSRSRSTGKTAPFPASPRRGARLPIATAASDQGLSLVLSRWCSSPEQRLAPPPQPRVAPTALAVLTGGRAGRGRAPGLGFNKLRLPYSPETRGKETKWLKSALL